MVNNRSICNIKEMMVQRGFEPIKVDEDKNNLYQGYLMGKNNLNEYIYIKIFDGKLELNIVRKFLWTNFIINSNGELTFKNQDGKLVQLIIVCSSFQNSHIKEFNEISVCIQLICSDFFNINITKKAPLHQKVDPNIIKNKKELPIIKLSDPNCIFYNFQKGDVIRVVRSDGDICYRLVK